MPKELLRRFLAIGDGATFVPLEDVIAGNLDALFPGMEIVHHSLFRVTRDTDYDVSDEADDMLQAVEEEVRRRRFGEVVRLEVDSGMKPRLRSQLVEALKIDESQVYEVDGLLGLDDLRDVADVPGFRELRYPPFAGVTPPQLAGRRPHARSTCSRRCARATSSSTTPTTPSRRRSSASSARRSRTRRAGDQADRLPDQRRTRPWSRPDRGARSAASRRSAWWS